MSSIGTIYMYVSVYGCVRVRACERACVRVHDCIRICMPVFVGVLAGVNDYSWETSDGSCLTP